MGIPSYFGKIVKNNTEILIYLSDFKKQIHNLYFDSNSIIYDILNNLSKDYHIYVDDNEFEKVLIQQVCEKIEEYILTLKPTKKVFITFDGVAPVAKLEQQRTRRYKSIMEQKIKNKIYGEKKSWNKTAITPGTKFMTKLNDTIKDYFKNTEQKLGLEKILISGSDEPGEGEHKLFNYIRSNPTIHSNEVTIVYGLDADLIMLCLNHLRISKQIYLYRENMDGDDTFILDIPMLSQRIIFEMNNNKKPSTCQETNRLYDYIFLCFFLGNDFLPHFPSLNIRTRGIDILINAYKHLFGKTNQNLTNGKIIYWKNVKKLINLLAYNEHNNLKEEYKIRHKWERRYYSKNTTSEDLKMERYLNIPTKNREIEKYIDPYNSLWNNRYYECLFHTDNSFDFRKRVSKNYMEGLEWVMNYYTVGCLDWNWKYNYHYPPLLWDLVKFIPNFNMKMIQQNNNVPVDSNVQLAYVLPKESLSLITNPKIKKFMEVKWRENENKGELMWAFCKYIWESHVDLPYLDIEELKILSK
jgi:5'-3' exoribonuclease 1